MRQATSHSSLQPAGACDTVRHWVARACQAWQIYTMGLLFGTSRVLGP